jgi:hypothetical protein
VDPRVEQVHRCLRALSGYCADPEGSMAALIAELAPDATWQDSDPDLDDDGLHHGHVEIEQRIWVVLAPYQRFGIVADTAEVRGDAVVAKVRATYTYRAELTANRYPKGNFEQSWWQVWLIRDGLVRYVLDVGTADELDDAVTMVCRS